MIALTCLCGFIIDYNENNHPYVGYLLRDQEADACFARISRDIAAHIQARAEGKTEVVTDLYRTTISLDEPIEETIRRCIVSTFPFDYGLWTYQCEQCGRIWTQEHPRSRFFRSFAPDAKRKDTLSTRNDPPFYAKLD